jgi:PAS domain S-box-containing protein
MPGSPRPFLYLDAVVPIVAAGAWLLLILRHGDGTVGPRELIGLGLLLVLGALIGVLRERLHCFRRRAEEGERRLRDTLAAIRDGVITTDTHGRVTFLNGVAEALTGWPRAEAVGRPLGEVFRVAAAPSRPGEPDSVEGVLRRGGSGRVHEPAQLLGRDGGRRAVESSAGRIEDEAGDVAGVVVVFRDITPRLSLEGQLRQAQKMEVVGRLSAGVAHDFNNLLTAINGYGDLLLGALPGGSPQREQVAEIRNAGERAARLTRQLLAFGRQQLLAPEVLDLNALVRGAQALLKRLLGEDVELVMALDPALSRVKVDRGQTEQVLLNLAVNARDAMPTGGRLLVETQNVARLPGPPDGGGRAGVLLQVGDTGCGMDETTLRQLFEPFFTTKPAGQGTGLGLATVYAIVTQAGGHIEVQSEPGRGSTFRVYLPAAEGVAAEEKPERPPPGSSDAPGGSETVLLVEDEDAVRALGRLVLRQGGYDVLEARDGGEALRLCAGHAGPIHLLVSDVVMPGLGGRQLAERLAESRPGMKVLFMSGYIDDAVVRHGVSAAEVAFLPKPFTPAALARKVREVLDGSPAGRHGASSGL